VNRRLRKLLCWVILCLDVDAGNSSWGVHDIRLFRILVDRAVDMRTLLNEVEFN
jgi:hypothetical protein